jgi:phage baseplate assembly protein W
MFNRNFGAKLKSFLFEPMNDRTAMSIKIYLVEAVGAWEPRIFVNMRDTYVIPDYDGGISGMSGYYVRIIYQIRTTQQIAEYVRVLPTQIGS